MPHWCRVFRVIKKYLIFSYYFLQFFQTKINEKCWVILIFWIYRNIHMYKNVHTGQNFFTSKLCYHPQKLTFKWDKYSDIIVMESFFCYWNFWRKLTSINSLETIKHGEFCFPSCCWLTLLSKYRMFWLTIILWFYNHVCLQHKVLKINNEKY